MTNLNTVVFFLKETPRGCYEVDLVALSMQIC